jgi:hypothetical protein
MQVDAMRRRYWLCSWIGIAIAGPIVLGALWVHMTSLFHPNGDEVRFVVGGQRVTYREFNGAVTFVFYRSLFVLWALCIAMPLIVWSPPIWLVATMIIVNWLIIAFVGSIFSLIIAISADDDVAIIIVLVVALIITWTICIVVLLRIFKNLKIHVNNFESVTRIALALLIIAAVIVGGTVLYHSLVLPPPAGANLG